MNKWLIIGGAVVGTLALSTLLVVGADRLGTHEGASLTATSAPWETEPLPGGRSRILGPHGLVLGGQLGDQPAPSTLADVQRLWPGTTQVAIVAAPGEQGTLEAYVDPVSLGVISGKLVVTVDLPSEVVQHMRERSPKAEFMESTTRKYELSPQDLHTAMAAPLRAVSFIPQAQLDAATVEQRFGPATERRTSTGQVLHLLYPARGLDVAISAEGRELLQYVAPAQFEQRLRAPLLKAAPASAATTATQR